MSKLKNSSTHQNQATAALPASALPSARRPSPHPSPHLQINLRSEMEIISFI